MSAHPIWFGPESRALFGWLHVPDGGRVRGGLVCCPATGVEATSAHRGFRALAERLEAAGYLALRFDYDGTGNSAGSEEDAERVGAWLASVDAAIGFVRAAGVERVGLIGLRLGGTLAAAAATAHDLDLEALVLWDPCTSGRAFIHEQQALKELHLGEAPAEGIELPSGSVELLGSVLAPTLVDDLSALDLSTIDIATLARRVLVLARSDRARTRRVIGHLDDGKLDWQEAIGEAEFVGVLPDASVVPDEAIENIVSWVVGHLGDDPITVEPETRPNTTTISSNGEFDVHERPVELGPLGLFGMLTTPKEPVSGPVLVLLNAGVIDHVGPARLWVTLARELAQSGIRTVRLDLSGLGESPARGGQTPHIAHAVEAMDDVGDIVEALRSDYPDGVILAGLCSGAYHAIECGLSPGVIGVCAINPVLQFDPPELTASGAIAPTRRAVQPYARWLKPFLRYQRLAEFGERMVPSAVWWSLEKLHLLKSSIGGVEQLASNDVCVFLLCGETEALQFTRRARGKMRRLIRSGQVRFEELHGIDHTLFGASARSRAVRAFTDYVSSTYGEPFSPPSVAKRESVAQR